MTFWLVVWNMNFIFQFSWECHTPTDEVIFFRGVGIPPTSFDQKEPTEALDDSLTGGPCLLIGRGSLPAVLDLDREIRWMYVFAYVDALCTGTHIYIYIYDNNNDNNFNNNSNNNNIYNTYCMYMHIYLHVYVCMHRDCWQSSILYLYQCIGPYAWPVKGINLCIYICVFFIY